MKSVYIHIPFCKHICSYCDFCKMYAHTKWIYAYLKALEKDIKSNHKGEMLSTIYIGGGSPSCLNIKALNKKGFTLSPISVIDTATSVFMMAGLYL